MSDAMLLATDSKTCLANFLAELRIVRLKRLISTKLELIDDFIVL